jgi:hypothetical protein
MLPDTPGGIFAPVQKTDPKKMAKGFRIFTNFRAVGASLPGVTDETLGTAGTVLDHERVHERRYASKVLIGNRVVHRPQLVHNFRNPQRVPHRYRI